MTERLDDTWNSREYPVLVEVTRRVDLGEHPQTSEIAYATGLSQEDVVRAGQALERRGLVTVGGSPQLRVHRFLDVRGEAYVLTGLHPSGDELAERIASVLEQLGAQSDDPDKGDRLNRLAGWFRDAARDVGTGVLGVALSRALLGGG